MQHTKNEGSTHLFPMGFLGTGVVFTACGISLVEVARFPFQPLFSFFLFFRNGHFFGKFWIGFTLGAL